MGFWGGGCICRYIYAGKLVAQGDHRRVFVNARQDADPPQYGEYELRRDLDLVIGITRDLPFLQAMAIFPMASFEDTLKKDKHMTRLIADPNASASALYVSVGTDKAMQNGPRLRVSLHKILNVALGEISRRHITRVFFPRLYRQGASPALSQTMLARIYDRCVRPAVLAVTAIDQSHWPVSYAAAMIQNRDVLGRFHYASIDIAANCLEEFGENFIRCFDEHHDFRDTFFLHELRGTKSVSLHAPSEELERRDALDHLLSFLRAEIINFNDWTIDVALEIRHAHHIVQWLTTAHRRVFEFVLPSADEHQISAILNSKKQYKCDLSAQLRDLGGCRVTPDSRGNQDSVSYINVYTTDKSPTYQLHSGVFRRRQASELLPSSIQKLVSDMALMMDVFKQCAENEIDNDNDTQEGCARLEIRVPLRRANQVLLDFPDDLVQACSVSYDTVLWW